MNEKYYKVVSIASSKIDMTINFSFLNSVVG